MDWHTVICIASGPSLTDGQIKLAVESGLPIIAVNRTIEKVPEATIAYAGDFDWWREYYESVEHLFDDGVELWTTKRAYNDLVRTHPRARDKVDFINCDTSPGLGTDGAVHYGNNSGYQAINLAYLMGAQKIILLGYDHKYDEHGNRHHHDDYPKKKFMSNAGHPELWLENFRQLAEDLDGVGVELVNCSRDTAIESCPRSTLSEELRTLAFVCVYRTGGDFGLDYVEELHDQITKYCNLPFYCISDEPSVPGYIPLKHGWEGWWSKLELFRNQPELEFFDILFADLDTVFTNDLTPLIVACEDSDSSIMLNDFYFPERSASGLMYIKKGDKDIVWDHWIENPEDHMTECGRLGDQKLIMDILPHKKWQSDFGLEEFIASYKLHISRKGVPSHILKKHEPKNRDKVGVVCYHGKPRPRDTGWDA